MYVCTYIGRTNCRKVFIVGRTFVLTPTPDSTFKHILLLSFRHSMAVYIRRFLTHSIPFATQLLASNSHRAY